MKHFKHIFKKKGYKIDWQYDDGIGYSNKHHIVRILYKEGKGDTVSMGSAKYFDRWANSSHINWEIMEKNNNWTEKMVEEDFLNNLRNAEWLCLIIARLLPTLFDNPLFRIDL
jgi:hypothetical protein